MQQGAHPTTSASSKRSNPPLGPQLVLLDELLGGNGALMSALLALPTKTCSSKPLFGLPVLCGSPVFQLHINNTHGYYEKSLPIESFTRIFKWSRGLTCRRAERPGAPCWAARAWPQGHHSQKPGGCSLALLFIFHSAIRRNPFITAIGFPSENLQRLKAFD